MRTIAVTAAVAMASLGCGGSDAPTSPTTPGGGATAATITIDANGVASPSQVSVSPGSRITFVNNDSRAHDMSSDPHPDHTDCPEIDQVGVLQPRQSRTTGNLNTIRTCGFHDHDNPTSRGLQGTIRIQ